MDLSEPRTMIERIASGLLATPEAALTEDFTWRQARRTVRFALYRVQEVLEESLLNLLPGVSRTRAGEIVALVSEARWSLHGSLLPYSDLIDDTPGQEWSLRLVLSHLIGAHEFWAWQTEHWLDELKAGRPVPLPGYIRDQVPDHLRNPAESRVGTLDGLRSELDRHVDGGLTNVLELEKAGALDAPVKFQGAIVTPLYYPVRWSAHLNEHHIQVHKTLALCRRERSELERIVEVVITAYGRLEGALIQSDAVVARPILAGIIAELEAHAI